MCKSGWSAPRSFWHSPLLTGMRHFLGNTLILEGGSLKTQERQDWQSRAIAGNENGSTQSGRTLILFYQSMWGMELGVPPDLPAGFEITTARERLGEADVVVFHIPELGFFGTPRKKPGQLWVAWSIESEENYPRLRNSRFMKRFDLTMTYRRDSDVLWGYAPYYGSAGKLAGALVAPPRPKNIEHPVVMMISSRIDRSGRRAYARELARHIPVDSYGRFLRNRTLPADSGRPTKLSLIASYPFTLAFENSICIDYVTEKFFDPLIAGSVPVYLGAPNIEDYAPGNHCYINVRDYANPCALAAYLKAVLAKPGAYEEYLEWKRQPLRPAFLSFLDSQRSHPLVRLCEAVRAVRNG